jgi:hypothetical protein
MKLTNRLNNLYNSRVLLWSIIGFGIFVRLIQYLSNRSLWLDEAALASSIVSRSYHGLLQLLDYNQVAPAGFLMIERFFVGVFGDSEYSLRLLPFLAGILSILLFYRLAEGIVSVRALPIALLLFSCSRFLIHYSADLKQYSTDVAVTLILFLIAKHVLSRDWSLYRVIQFAVVGAISIWFSHPAVFILAGIGLTIILVYATQRKWKRIAVFLPVFFVWAGSFIISYVCILSKYHSDSSLLEYWHYGFVPFPPLSFAKIQWFPNAFEGWFRNPGGFSSSVVFVAFFGIFGYISIFKNNRKYFILLLSGIPFALLASTLQAYPFGGRVVLYTVPILLLGVAEGTELIRKKLWPYIPITAGFIVVFIVLPPVLRAGMLIVKPFMCEEIKPVLKYVEENHREQDVIYFYRGAQKAYRYYADRYNFSDTRVILGIKAKQIDQYRKDLETFRGGKRVWLVFTHSKEKEGLDEEAFFLYHLNRMGSCIDSFKSHGGSVYLYDLSGVR